VDDAEDRGCRTDSQRQSHDGNGSEARTLRKHPQTVANILPNTGHRHTSRVWVKTYNSGSDLSKIFPRKPAQRMMQRTTAITFEPANVSDSDTSKSQKRPQGLLLPPAKRS